MKVNNPLTSFPFCPKKISSFEDQQRVFKELISKGYKWFGARGESELNPNSEFNWAYPWYIHELKSRKHVTWTYERKRWDYEST